MNSQAIVNAHDKCIHLSILTSGSTHENTACAVCPLRNEWPENLIIDPCTGWHSLDDAYQATGNHLPPHSLEQALSLAHAPFEGAFKYFFLAGKRNIVIKNSLAFVKCVWVHTAH